MANFPMSETNNSKEQVKRTKKELRQEETKIWAHEIYKRMTIVPKTRMFLDFLSYLMIVLIVPLSVTISHQPGASISTIEGFRIQENLDLIFPIIFIGFSFMNIYYVREFTKDRALFEEIYTYLKQQGVDIGLQLDVSNTQASKMINQMQLAYIIGTFFVVSLWYTFYDHGRLEPLTILYGFGTALFGYFRTRLSINNPIDEFLENADSTD